MPSHPSAPAPSVESLLVTARKFLERGWCTGSPARRADGTPCFPTDRDASCFSVLGSLMRACKGVGIAWDSQRAFEAVFELHRSLRDAAVRKEDRRPLPTGPSRLYHEIANWCDAEGAVGPEALELIDLSLRRLASEREAPNVAARGQRT